MFLVLKNSKIKQNTLPPDKSEYLPTLNLLSPVEKPAEAEQQKLWDGTECHLPFIRCTLFLCVEEKYISVHIMLAKFGRQRAY